VIPWSNGRAMSDRPTLKLKPGAAARDPQRLRVRATTAPRQSAADTKPAATEAQRYAA
jgi:hypothetical protein